MDKGNDRGCLDSSQSDRKKWWISCIKNKWSFWDKEKNGRTEDDNVNDDDDDDDEGDDDDDNDEGFSIDLTIVDCVDRQTNAL